MAKKKRKKRRQPPRPVSPEQESGPARQDRKEQARKEREARMKRARRRQSLRRLTRFAILLAVAGLIAGIVWFANAADRRTLQAASAAAEQLRCGPVQELPNKGREHQPPFQYSPVPGTSGNHSPQTLDPAVPVYEDPIDDQLEPLAVHSMEHAYVIMYYRQDGPTAPSAEVIEALAGLARDEDKVILAPYYQMPEGRGLAFAAWTRLQTCPKVTDAAAAVDVAKGFISQFRGGGEAPEPNAA
jgi:hypothetical protein